MMSGLPGGMAFHQEINGFVRVVKGYEEKIAMYEKALLEACKSLAENEICPVKDCPTAKLSCGEDNEPQCYGDNCHAEIFVDYFKKQAGLAVKE